VREIYDKGQGTDLLVFVVIVIIVPECNVVARPVLAIQNNQWAREKMTDVDELTSEKASVRLGR